MKLRALLLLLSLAASVQAQQPSQAPAVRSPEVSADRRITFRVLAPNASKVTVFCECLTSEPAMTKGADGVWSVTVGPVEADIYEYHFTVDGVDNLDQRNPGRQIQQPPESDRERRRRPRTWSDVLRREARSARQRSRSGTTRRRPPARRGARLSTRRRTTSDRTTGFRCCISCTAPTATKPRGRNSAAPI